MIPLLHVTLPDETAVWAANAFEAVALYQQIVTDRVYEQHGIHVGHGGVVFDVGANIGVYAIHLARTVPGVRVHSFEPIPDLFEALTRNLAALAPETRSHNVGLAAESGDAVFELDRFNTFSSTMHAGEIERAKRQGVPVSEWASAALADLDRAAPGNQVVRRLRTGVDTPGLRLASLAALAPIYLALRVRRRVYLQRRRCVLRTLSSAIEDSGADQIDLVKIDVEGAEEQVIQGLSDADWPRIRQFVIEVHDVDGRAARMTAELEKRGYRTACPREDWRLLELMGISTLYAIRRAS